MFEDEDHQCAELFVYMRGISLLRILSCFEQSYTFPRSFNWDWKVNGTILAHLMDSEYSLYEFESRFRVGANAALSRY